jgi:Uncharacterized protein conserved in bacteria (DUF2325)
MTLLAQKALSKIGGGRCRLTGRDADLIYSITRDFGTRNPLSEIFQRDFEARHKKAIAQLSSVKSPDQLARQWSELMDSGALLNEIGSTLWATLTHPYAEVIQNGIIYEMRAWVLGQMRACAVHKRQSSVQAQITTEQQKQTVASQVRLRQAQNLLELERAESLRLQCELNGLIQRMNSRELEFNMRLKLDVATTKIPSLPQAENQLSTDESRRWRNQLKEPEQVTEPQSTTQIQPVTKPTVEKQPCFTPINIFGKRILCVGGLTGSQSLYRQALEKAGGQCQFHDGGLEDSVRRLPVMIESVDVVICQTGCINHEAYQHVKRLCNRTGKPCVYLERPSISQLRKYLAEPKNSSPKSGTYDMSNRKIPGYE